MVTATQPVKANEFARTRQAIRQGAAGGHGILAFPLPETAPAQPKVAQPCCLWCGQSFTPIKPNQVYCKRKHSQYASQRRKDTLITALADLLQCYGAKPATALAKAADVVEANFRDGRIQRTMQALGYRYDDTARAWLLHDDNFSAGGKIDSRNGRNYPAE